MRICFDYGHGGKDSGAVLGQRKESQDVLAFGQKVAHVLRAYDIIVDETRNKDRYIGLDERVAYANKGNYQYFISFHRNSSRPAGPRGVEVFTATSCSPKATAMAQAVQKALVQVGFKDRGMKKMNFYVLQKTKMPAILIELGFINSPMDNCLFDTCNEELIQTLSHALLKQIKILK